MKGNGENEVHGSMDFERIELLGNVLSKLLNGKNRDTSSVCKLDEYTN
jgi:hypothetical protein